MVSREPSLVSSFDELVAASDILIDGSEKVFSEFVSSQMGVYAEVNNLEAALRKKAEKIEAKDIELKLSRTSLQRQMDKCTMQEERLKEYEKQFMILKVLISSDDKLINLNEAEKRSLAILRQKSNATQSPGAVHGHRINSTDDWGTPETSVNVTDATDLDDDEAGVGYRAHWKRRRTCSSEYTLDSSVSKRKRSVESSLLLDEPRTTIIPTKQQQPSLIEQPSYSVKEEQTTNHHLPPLEQQFKRPPPGKNRRKPSQGHLVKRNVQIETPPVPPLDLPKNEDSAPVPSAPPGFPDRILSEVEVALVNSGLLSPCSNECSPRHMDPDANPDILAVFPHSPLSPVSVQPVPSSPSMGGGTPRLYPVLETENVDCSEYGVLDSPTYAQPIGLTRTNSDINMTRKHTFQTKTALKLENCEVCKKRVNVLGKSFLKCQDCKAICCVDCQNKVPLPCVPTVRTPKKKSKEVDLAAYCPNVIPRVPSLIVHCVKELESRGLVQVGLYRVPGSDRSIKDLRERLMKVKGTPKIDKVEDVNVLCGCIKQFLISLKEPLVTNALNPAFLKSVGEDSEEKILASLFESIAKLPTCNRDTLAFMILHLQKIIERSDSNKMPVDSIARVFGPTIIGSISNDPKIAVKDIEKQKIVMIKLLNISSAYWRQFLSNDDHLESGSPRLPEHPNLPSTPMLNSPSTPELMPIPQSPFLGPCQSPRVRRPPHYGANIRTPVVTRSVSANSNFMNSVSRSAKKNGFFAAIN